MKHYDGYREFFALKMGGVYVNSLGILIHPKYLCCHWCPEDPIIVFNTKESLLECLNYIEKGYPSEFKQIFDVVNIIVNNNDVYIINKEQLIKDIKKLKELDVNKNNCQ